MGFKPSSGITLFRNASNGVTSVMPKFVPRSSMSALNPMGGQLIRTIGQVRAKRAMTMIATCYNPTRIVYFNKAGIAAF